MRTRPSDPLPTDYWAFKAYPRPEEGPTGEAIYVWETLTDIGWCLYGRLDDPDQLEAEIQGSGLRDGHYWKGQARVLRLTVQTEVFQTHQDPG